MKNLSPKSLGEIRMSEKERDQRKKLIRAARPRIASTIVLTHGPKDNPRILMGQRSSKHDFMPSVYVFPGGRVDRGDSYVDYAGDLSPRTETIMEAAFTPRKARAVVLASVRETYEETSLLLGTPSKTGRNHSDPSWDAFREAGLKPDLEGIEVFGRAVTPLTAINALMHGSLSNTLIHPLYLKLPIAPSSSMSVGSPSQKFRSSSFNAQH